MRTHALTIRTAITVLGLIASMQAGAGGNVVDQTLQQILAQRPPQQSICYGTPRYQEQARVSWSLAIVTTRFGTYEDGKCTSLDFGEELAIYIDYDGSYRELKKTGGDGHWNAKLFVYHGTGSQQGMEEVLLGIEHEMSGTGNFREYELYRLNRSGELEPVAIKSPLDMINAHVAKGQGAYDPAYSFDDDDITFGTAVLNPGETVRFASGGSASGKMMLVHANSGFELVAVPGSLQMSAESRRLNGLALGAQRAGKYDEALDYYRQALEWDRHNYEAAADLGLLYMRRKEWNAAIEISARVADTNDASRAIRASAAYNAGRAFESGGDRKRAAVFYRKAIDFQDSPERRAALARLCPGADECK